MTRKEQMITILREHIYTNVDTIVRSNSLELIADAILAMPLSVPTEKEIVGDAMTYSAYPAMPDGHPEFEPSKAEDFGNGANWAIREIITRNKE